MTNATDQATALASWMRGLAQHMASVGIDLQPVFADLGLSWNALEEPNARYPVELTTKLWQHCVTLTNDEAIGLKAIRYITPTTFSSVGMGILASRTLREAFNRLSRFADLISDASRIELIDLPDGQASLRIILRADVIPADQATDGLTALLANTGRALGQPSLKPSVVRLIRAHPGQQTADYFHKVFDTDIAFGCPNLQLEFAAGVIDEPLHSGNPMIADHLDAASMQAIEAMKAQITTEAKVRIEIKAGLAEGNLPNTEAIANKLAMSVRNLQRKLAEEGTSVANITDEIRRAEAQKRLADASQSLTNIAFDLGFSDASAFNRACRRWFGKTPSQLRGN